MPLRRRFALLLSAATAALLAAGVPGCGWLPREPAVPMPVQRFPATCGTQHHTLLVLLPGRGMTLGELAREGFVDAFRTQRLAVDLVLADAHLGYFKARTVVQRLHADVIAPARAQGDPHIRLAGISLGGLNALLYAGEHPAATTGSPGATSGRACWPPRCCCSARDARSRLNGRPAPIPCPAVACLLIDERQNEYFVVR